MKVMLLWVLCSDMLVFSFSGSCPIGNSGGCPTSHVADPATYIVYHISYILVILPNFALEMAP